jgi:hypothetical protein
MQDRSVSLSELIIDWLRNGEGEAVSHRTRNTLGTLANNLQFYRQHIPVNFQGEIDKDIERCFALSNGVEGSRIHYMPDVFLKTVYTSALGHIFALPSEKHLSEADEDLALREFFDIFLLLSRRLFFNLEPASINFERKLPVVSLHFGRRPCGYTQQESRAFFSELADGTLSNFLPDLCALDAMLHAVGGTLGILEEPPQLMSLYLQFCLYEQNSKDPSR